MPGYPAVEMTRVGWWRLAGTIAALFADFRRDATGAIAALTWHRDGHAPRIARRVTIERREEVRFSNGTVHLAGTLTSPAAGGRHPAIVLVYVLRTLPKANHAYLEAELGSNAEMPGLGRFVPEYRTTILNWLTPRLKASPSPR